MALSARDYATALALAAEGQDDKGARRTAKRFVAVMRERGLSYLLPAVAEALEGMPQVGRDAVRVESARPLDAADLSAAVGALGLDPASAVITPVVRPELLGGVRIVGTDRLLDASVRRRIDDLGRATGAKPGAERDR